MNTAKRFVKGDKIKHTPTGNRFTVSESYTHDSPLVECTDAGGSSFSLVRTEVETDYSQPYSHEIDLETITGSPITKIFGYITTEFGEPTFQMTRIITADEKSYHAEGEHDCPYLTDLDQDKLDALNEDENDEDDGDEEDEES